MSNLASSCEHLGLNKSCALFSGNSAQFSRQLKCQNDQKTMCCYLCVFRSSCVISCKYLGLIENDVELKRAPEDLGPVDKGQGESLSLERVPVAFCFSCNMGMAWSKTQFSVDSWGGNSSTLVNDKLLSVTVLLCPSCGKIEFKADLKR